MNTITPACIHYLKDWEGIKTKPYHDSANLLTIGVGHKLTKSELNNGTININTNPVPFKNGLTVQQCEDLLKQDLHIALDAVNTAVRVPLSEHQFIALLSLAFNIGATAFKKSTLVKLLNRGDYAAIPDQLRRWNKSGGKVVQGLINRREKEIAAWNKGG